MLNIALFGQLLSISRCSQRPGPALPSICSPVKSGLARLGMWTDWLGSIHWGMLSMRCAERHAFQAIIPIIPSGPQQPQSCTVMKSMSNLSWKSLAIGPLQFDHTRGPRTSRGRCPVTAPLERSELCGTPLDNRSAPASHHWVVFGRNIH